LDVIYYLLKLSIKKENVGRKHLIFDSTKKISQGQRNSLAVQGFLDAERRKVEGRTRLSPRSRQ